jgi:hypothetical protein
LIAADGSGLIASRQQFAARTREVAVAIRCVRFDGQGAMQVLGDVAVIGGLNVLMLRWLKWL